MKSSRRFIWALAASAASALFAQNQTSYAGKDVTGQFTLTATVDATQAALKPQQSPPLGAFALAFGMSDLRDTPKHWGKRLHPPMIASFSSRSGVQGAARSLAVLGATADAVPAPVTDDLSVIVQPSEVTFNGLTHLDQRSANHGNQFSVEPPNTNIAVANGYILEGVNNAIQVYDTSGNPLLPRVLSTNELFGLPPAIDRTTNVYGPFPTDMRVFYDAGIDRWFVLQRAQDEDTAGDFLSTSHIYLAVSQTSDPTGVYDTYTADTTDSLNVGCPCFADYPQIGADRNGFYISANEFNSFTQTFVDATIFAISKASLASGAATPRVYNFTLPFDSGYEFAIQPASTPPGASYFLADGGLEYFASTVGQSPEGGNVAVWAMVNTASLNSAQPNPTLLSIIVPTMSYNAPPASVTQPDGDRPLGNSLGQPVPFIDGGDTRVLSLSYSGGRLYLTFSIAATDKNSNTVVGAAFLVLSPTYRGNLLAGRVLRQNVLVVDNSALLRPSVAVNALGKGGIAATVVGPTWYPSAALVPVNALAAPSTVQITAAGTVPEDGFTGYFPDPNAPIARWGDYNSAVIAKDGSFWGAAEYTTNLPRIINANWDTLVMKTEP